MPFSFSDPVDNSLVLDISSTSTNQGFVNKTPKEVEDRANRYAFGLGDKAPSIDEIKTLLNTPGGEDELRRRAAQQEDDARLETAREVVKTGTTQEALNAIENVKKGTDPNSILEKKTAQRIMDTSLAVSRDQTALPEGMTQTAYDSYVDTMTRYEAFNKMLEDQRAKNRQAGWGTWGVEMAEGLIPLWSATSQRNTTLGEKLSSILPGNNKQEQYDYLRRLPADEAIKVAKQVAEEMSSSNGQEAEAWLSGLAEGYSASSSALENLFAVADVASLTPAGAARKALTKGAAKGTEELVLKGAEGLSVKEAARSAEKLKEVYNVIKTPAKDLVKGDLRSTILKEAEAQKLNKLERTALAATQPNAKVDEVLAAAGHIEEASHIRALEVAKGMAPDAGKSIQDGIADLVKRTPMLANPKAFFIDMSNGAIRRSEELANSLVRSQAMASRFLADTVSVSRLPPDVERMALDQAEEALQERARQGGFHTNLIGSIEKKGSETSVVNIAYLESRWGKKDGTLFQNAKVAQNFAINRMGLPKGSFDIVQEGDGFAVLTRHDIDETNPRIRDAILSTDNRTNIERNKILGIIPLPKALNSYKDTVSLFQGDQRAALTHGQTAAQAFMAEMTKSVKSLSKDERASLSKIMEINRDFEAIPGRGETRGMFYNSVQELEDAYASHFKRLPSDKEVEAYFKYVQQSDLQYIETSISLLKKKSREGVLRVEFAGKEGPAVLEAKPIEKLPFGSRENAGVFIQDGAGSYHRLNEAGFAEAFTTGAYKDWKVFQVAAPDSPKVGEVFGTNNTINFVVAKDAKVGSLRFDEQLNYRPGFHVRYNEPYFIKQPKIVYNSTGTRTYHGDTTVLGVSFQKKGQRELKWLEDARLAVKNNDEAALDAVINAGFPMTKEEIKQAFKTTYDVNTPFMLTKDGQSAADPSLFTLRNSSLADEVGHFEDFHNSSWNLARKWGMGYTSHKDSKLWAIGKKGTEENPLYTFDEARMLDPMRTQVESMNQLIRDRHFSDYQLASSESFVQEFADMITLDGKNGLSKAEIMRNPVYYVMNGKLKGNIADQRYAAARTSQLAIQNLMRHDSVISKSLNQLYAKVLDSAYSRWGEKYTPVLDKFASAPVDLVGKMRALAFHTKMGFFNVAQLPLQVQSVSAAVAISPKHGLSGMFTGLMMQRLGIFPADEEAIKHVAKQVGKITPGWTAEQFEESFAHLRKTGFDIVGGDYSYRNDFADYTIHEGKFGKFLDWGATPFNVAERYVRLTAWNTAYKEYIDYFPKLAGKLTDKDTKSILSRAQDLSINMSRDAHARWQEGDMSLVTQFWGYNMRMFDLLTGQRLTPDEKFRLVAMNSALYGLPVGFGMTVPFLDWRERSKEYLMENGYATNEGIADALTNGMIAATVSGLTSALTGEDVQLDIPARWGPGSLTIFEDIIKAKQGETGFDQLMQIAGGASGSILGNILNDVWQGASDIGYLLSGGDADHIIAQDAINTLKTISTFNNLEKIYMAYNLGVLKDKKQRTVDGNYTVFEGVVSALTGLQPQSASDAYTQMRSAIKQQEFENKISTQAKVFLRLYFNSVAEGDTGAAKEYLDRATNMLNAGNFTDKQRRNLMKSVAKEPSFQDKSKEMFTKTPNSEEEQAKRQNALGGAQ